MPELTLDAPVGAPALFDFSRTRRRLGSSGWGASPQAAGPSRGKVEASTGESTRRCLALDASEIWESEPFDGV